MDAAEELLVTGSEVENCTDPVDQWSADALTGATSES